VDTKPEFPEEGWPRPVARTFAGRFITLTPLDPERDGEGLFAASHGSSGALEMWRYLARGPYTDAAAMREGLRSWQALPDVLAFTVTDNATGRRIGSISLLRIEPTHGVAELGYIWYAPAMQRTKANTEANYLLLRHCLAELGYRRMEWKCDNANEPSKRAALRLGYRYEGTFRQHMIIRGNNRDTAWFSLLDHEWPLTAAALEHWLYVDDSLPLAEVRQRLVVRGGPLPRPDQSA
jgi:RimJ/RimL family protein N-acetyltransferase